jgi:protein TonB
MFETALLPTGRQTKRTWTTFIGVTGQVLLVGGLVLAPLISPAALPRVVWSVALAPPSPPSPPPVPVRVTPVSHTTIVRSNVFREPTSIPRDVKVVIDDVAEAAPPGPTVIGAVPSVGGPGDSIGILHPVQLEVPRPRPPDTAPVTTPKATPTPTKPPRITVLQMAEPIQRINPIYPPIARAARIGGKVELLGVLGTDGRIHEIKVLSGHPLLVKAAVDAVMQWVYRPTILNGQPVEVQAPITVTFILN